MSEPKPRRCKDCAPDSKRPAPHAGPRCASHYRETVKARKVAAHEARVAKVYGLLPGGYEALKDVIQGGMCAICQRANGRTKRLAVDHCHASGDVRGLLCGPCNKIIGVARDDPAFFERAAYYLRQPPALLLDPKFLEAR